MTIEPRPPVGRTPRRYEYIDTMRGIAIMLVLASHVKNLFPYMYWKAFTLTEFGGHGVQLFFVASALTLMLSWNARGDGARKFYIRRLFRIAPMFWLAIAVYTLLFRLGLYPDGSVDWRDIALTSVFLHGLSPTAINLVVPGGWTIAVEMTFYLVFPIVAMLVTSLPRAIGFVIASIAFASVSNSVLPHVLTGLTWNELGFFSYYWFPANLQSFACGCLAYHLLPFAPGLARRRGAGTAIGLMALLIAVFTAWYGLPWFSTMEAPWSRATLASFASLALAMALAVHSPRWLVNPMTCYVGQVSYSAYLLHFMIFEPVLAHFGPIGVGPVVSMIGFAGSFVAIAAMTVGLSGLTWRAIERPGITAGNRLIARCFATGVVSRANYP